MDAIIGCIIPAVVLLLPLCLFVDFPQANLSICPSVSLSFRLSVCVFSCWSVLISSPLICLRRRIFLCVCLCALTRSWWGVCVFIGCVRSPCMYVCVWREELQCGHWSPSQTPWDPYLGVPLWHDCKGTWWPWNSRRASPLLGTPISVIAQYFKMRAGIGEREI